MEIYEWVLTMSRGNDIVLTEKQYDYYDKNRETPRITFDNFEFSPFSVVRGYKRKATELIRMYPCETCHGGGIVALKDKAIVCKSCKGTKLNLKLLGYVK